MVCNLQTIKQPILSWELNSGFLKSRRLASGNRQRLMNVKSNVHKSRVMSNYYWLIFKVEPLEHSVASTRLANLSLMYEKSLPALDTAPHLRYRS